MTSEQRRIDLRRATLQGVRWISIARLVAETSALAASIVLARLLMPAEFGRGAIALIVVGLAAVLGPAGLTAVLVQRSDIDRTHVDTAAVISVVAGLTLTLLTLAFALTVGVPLFGEETADLLLIAAPAWLITSVGAVPQAMLQRRLEFRRIAIVDSTSVLLGTGTALVLAITGTGAAALVVGGLVATASSAALASMWSRPTKPRPTVRALSEVGGFATPVALSSLVYSIFRNVDYAILGARLSAADVGYYYRAYQLGVDYQSKLSQIMLRVSFPVYSRTESLEELRQLRMRIVRVHASVIVPLLATFVAVAPIAVPWVFGRAWEPSVVPAQIMAVAGVGHALTTGTGPLLVAIGRPGALLFWNVCELVLYAALVFLLAPFGLTAVALGVAGFAIFAIAVNQVALLGPLLHLPARMFAAEVAPGLVAGATVLGCLVGLRELLARTDVPAAVRLLALGSMAVVVYAAVMRTVFGEVWRDLVAIGRRIGGRGEDRVAAELAVEDVDPIR